MLDEPENANSMPPEREALSGASLGSARSLLFTLLGEYVFPRSPPVWTATLLKALVGLGIAEKSARQAIARAASAGWIEGVRDGRRVSWQLTPRMRRSMELGVKRVRSISQEPQHWDGKWIVLAVSLPEARRTIRTKLYRSLRWAGFGTPSAGLWVNPHADRIGETGDIIQRLDLQDIAYAFTGESHDLGVSDEELVQRAWQWRDINAEYHALLTRFEQLAPRHPEELFQAHFGLAHEWQQLPFIDPGMPRELLPEGAKGLSSARRLDAMRDALGIDAHRYWDRISAAQPPR